MSPRNTRLELRRTFSCSPETLFACFADPEHLAKWWGPRGVTVPELALDVRPGGKWRTVMRNSEGRTFVVQGVYKEVRPPERLVFTWAWEDETGKPGHESLVTLRFAAEGEGCALHLVHENLENADSRKGHREGWLSSFGCLEDYAAEIRATA